MTKRQKKSKDKNSIAVGTPQLFLDVTNCRPPGTRGAKPTERDYFIWHAQKHGTLTIRQLAIKHFGSANYHSRIERIVKKVEAEQRRLAPHPPNEAHCPCGTKFVEKTQEAAHKKMTKHLKRDCPFRAEP